MTVKAAFVSTIARPVSVTSKLDATQTLCSFFVHVGGPLTPLPNRRERGRPAGAGRAILTPRAPRTDRHGHRHRPPGPPTILITNPRTAGDHCPEQNISPSRAEDTTITLFGKLPSRSKHQISPLPQWPGASATFASLMIAFGGRRPSRLRKIDRKWRSHLISSGLKLSFPGN